MKLKVYYKSEELTFKSEKCPLNTYCRKINFDKTELYCLCKHYWGLIYNEKERDYEIECSCLNSLGFIKNA